MASPSHITWADVHHFTNLDGVIRKSPPEIELSVPPLLKEIIPIVTSRFRNMTELEATVRVLSFVTSILPNLPAYIHVQLQPSVQNHPTVTDALIVRADDSNKQPLSFIEIKKLEVYTSLCVKGSATAQALREAHILCGSDRPLPFVLTNSQVWSFGLVKKRGTKIDLLEYFDVHIDERGQYGVELLLAALKSVLLGKWPHESSDSKETGAGPGPAKETAA